MSVENGMFSPLYMYLNKHHMFSLYCCKGTLLMLMQMENHFENLFIKITNIATDISRNPQIVFNIVTASQCRAPNMTCYVTDPSHPSTEINDNL